MAHSLGPASAGLSQYSFTTANPHALARILEASETRTILACRDIFDISGMKLWARNQPVSQELQRRLLDRKLRQPLEACLAAEHGITTATLVKAAYQSLDGRMGAWPLVASRMPLLVREISSLPIHPVVQLLLTVTHEGQPGRFAHAVDAMLLNGAISIAGRASTTEVRVALLAGLLHDLGEMYLAPASGEGHAGRRFSDDEYRQMVVHPHIGRLLLAQLTDYPDSLALAVAEHHERLDGSGYPGRLAQESISPRGAQLAAVQAVIDTLDRPTASAGSAAIALRLVPGEFSQAVVDLVTQSFSDRGQAPGPEPAPAGLAERTRALEVRLDVARQTARRVADGADGREVRQAASAVSSLIDRLRAGWHASGGWAVAQGLDVDVPELEAVTHEVSERLQALRWYADLMVPRIEAADQLAWSAVLASLDAGT